MKPQLSRYAPFGLWLSLVSALTAVVLYILQRQWNLPLQISLGLMVIGLAVFALLDPDRVRKALTGRTARYGSNAVVLVLAFIGILVVINYLAYQNDKRWDLTADKENTLADQTLEVLSQLPAAVSAKAFFTPNTSSETANNLLAQYAHESDGKFTFEFIDPVSDPVAANDAKVTQDGSIVLMMGDASQIVDTVTEDELTSALVRLMNPNGKAVYFLTGHGEFSVEDSGDTTYAQLKLKLEGKNYTVASLNLLAVKQIPADADVIVIGGPQISLDELEITLIGEFMNIGGSVVVMEEPIPLTKMNDGVDLLADYLAETWGVVLGKDIVVDFQTEQVFMAYAGKYGSHPIAQKMQNIVSVFPTARSVTVTDAISEGVSQTVLISTADQSWAETDLAGLEEGKIDGDPESDLMGPVSLAVAAENFSNGARMVVFGDAEFASNTYFTAYGNADMIVNSIDWAAGEEDMINLTAREATTRTLMTPNTLTLGLLFLGSIILLPGIVVAGGITAWIIRRRHG